MRISVFGLGYVGSVTAACLAGEGHTVIGVDLNPLKVDPINEGKSPILEKGLDDLVREVVERGALVGTVDSVKAVMETEVSLICVGTPSQPNGDINLTYVRRVSVDIGRILRKKDGRHTVIFRSTMLPGSTETILIPLLESASGKSASQGLSVGVNPEFLREGDSLHDFHHPSRIVIGARDERVFRTVADIYQGIEAPLEETTIRTAEMIKYIDNSFHALKVCFANEIAESCRAAEVDPYEAMRLFALDRQLNISAAYLRPGFAFGGSCLPKDLRAILHKSRREDLDLPLLSSILPSNARQISRAVERILETGKQSIGILGLSFKPGTDDLRESPIIQVAETLLGKGYELHIYDPSVNVGRLHGSNKAFLEQQLPHLSSLLSHDLESLVRASEVIVVGSRQKEFLPVLDMGPDDRLIIDLVGLERPALG